MYAPNIKNLIESQDLKWVFVGGKGGVGKTTISSSLAILFAQYRKKVLIISTDPAHSLSDALNQKLGKIPTLIKGFENLYGLELDPEKDADNIERLNGILNVDLSKTSPDTIKQMQNSFPGIDESLNLKYIASLIDDKDFDVVIFDTAPTGHTLRLLDLPKILETTLSKILELKSNYSSLIDSISAIIGGNVAENLNKIFNTLAKLSESLQKIADRFADPNKTSFVSVCIPEFLSVYETERLVMKLFEKEMDCRNIVVNQILPVCEDTKCKMCKARKKMQDKNLNEINEKFEDFHIIKISQQKQEIRGIENLKKFCTQLLGEENNN